MSVGASSSGAGHSQGAPAAPGSPTATCVSSNSRTARVGWVTVAGASSYTVYDSTNGVSGSYSSLTSGATGTSFTRSVLGAGTYYFKIGAVAGTTWIGSQSAATTARTIRTSGTLCA